MARDGFRALHNAAPGNGPAASQLSISLGSLGRALRDEKRPAEAVASFVEALQVLVAIRQPSFTYTAEWSVKGQVITVRREMVAAFDAPLCSGEIRRSVAAAMAEIRRDQRAKIVLSDP